jgi:hypothetical protein
MQPCLSTGMGLWTNHCSHCRPSQELRNDLATIVDSAPDGWEFEVITESGSLGLQGMPKLGGTFVVGVYIPSDEKVLPMLNIAFMDDERYILSIKADHNACASYGPPKEQRYPQLLAELRDRIFDLHPTFLNWKPSRRTGDLAISAFRYTCDDQDEAEEQFMEAIDLLNEKGWFA